MHLEFETSGIIILLIKKEIIQVLTKPSGRLL